MKLINILLLIAPILATQKVLKTNEIDEVSAIDNLRQFLKLDTSHPNPNYTSTVNYLKDISKQIGLKYSEFKCQPSNTPSVILTWEGVDNNLPSIVLSSHYDVVPVVKEHWTYPPFNATITKDPEGYDAIYARGSQDTKSLGIMYLEAIRYLKNQFKQGPLRTLHILFVPDEEVGGNLGMKCFADSFQWQQTFGEIAMFLDEGFPNSKNEVLAFYGERVQRGFKVTARGDTGHASQFIHNLATDKMAAFDYKMRIYRHQQERKMILNKLELGDVTTPNLDKINAGTAINVVPDMVETWYDVRVTPLTDINQLQKKFESFAKESNVSYQQISKDQPHFTELKGFKMWEILKYKADEFGFPLRPSIFPAATDSRHLRGKGIPAIGLSPIKNHPMLAHANDEYLRINAFIQGIKFYIHCLPALFHQ